MTGLLVQRKQGKMHGAGRCQRNSIKYKIISQKNILLQHTWYCRGQYHQGRFEYRDWAGELCGMNQFFHFWRKCLASRSYSRQSSWDNEFYLKQWYILVFLKLIGAIEARCEYFIWLKTEIFLQWEFIDFLWNWLNILLKQFNKNFW